MTDMSRPEAAPAPEKTATIAPSAARTMPLAEFIALMAAISAVTALSIDAMLPAFPSMAADMGLVNENRIQLVLATFAWGMGVGTVFAGPITDWLGRKRAITLGFGLYIVASIGCAMAPSLEWLLVGRFVMGLAASAPRIAGVALIRDLYAGREMARIVSFVMMVFMIVPAMAPLMGEWIMSVGSWRGIFHAYVLFGLGAMIWLNLRQPETLPPERRRPLTVRSVIAGVREVLSERQIVLCAVAMTLGFGQMFSMLMSSKQLFTETYGQGDNFTKWFALMAVLGACGTFANARLVMRVGMRRIVNWTFGLQALSSAVMLVLAGGGLLPGWAQFPVFFVWASGLMGVAGLTFGNLNAIAMQYKGNIAGTTASVISAISTFFGALIAAAVGQSYDGTVVPLALATMLCSAVALMVGRRLK